MTSRCERLYGWNAVDDRTQPACLSAHVPRGEAGARERDNEDTIACPVVNYVSLTPVTRHCSQDQTHLEERILDHRREGLLGPQTLCKNSGYVIGLSSLHRLKGHRYVICGASGGTRSCWEQFHLPRP